MELYPEALRQRDLKPVVTLIGSPRITEEFILALCSSPRQMDYEQFTFGQDFECRREVKLVDRVRLSGILPKHWPTKRRKYIPAVLALLFDWTGRDILDPQLDGPEWRHKEVVILREVRRYREQMKGRFTKISIFVFLSDRSAAEAGTDERSSQLRKLCELDSKAVHLVAGSPSAMSGILAKVHKHLYDNAISHYKEEVDRIKKAKSRAISVELQVRFNFKLGYLMELREDKDGGLRYYQSAYQELQDIPPISPNHYREIKGVSDWLLLRLCIVLTSQSPALQRVKEAIIVFKSHWLKYKIIRYNETHFEIWAWQVQQFAMFAQLLEGVNSNNYDRKNKMTLPGFYYETAAVFSLKRLEITRKSAAFAAKLAAYNDLINSQNFRFKDPFYVGQLKSLAAHPLQDSIDIMPPSEQDLMSLIINESLSDPASDSLKYFLKARKFYSEFGSLRSLISVSKQVAELYADSGDLAASDRVLTTIYESSQLDHWPTIQKIVSTKLLESARALGRNSDVQRYLLEVMSLDPKSAVTAFNSFRESMLTDMVALEIAGKHRYLSVRSQFKPNKISTYDVGLLDVTLQSKFPTSLENISVDLKFGESQFDRIIAQKVGLEPGVPVTFSTQILVTSSLIQTVELKAVIVHYFPTELSSLSMTFPVKKTRLSLQPPPSKLSASFRQSPPALIAETYVVDVTLTPEMRIPQCTLSISEDTADQSPYRTKVHSRPISAFYDGNELSSEGLDLFELTSPKTFPISFIFTEEGPKNLKVKLGYFVKKEEVGEEIEYFKEDVYPLDIAVMQPFQLNYKWSCETDYLPVREVVTLVSSLAPHSIFLSDVLAYRIALELKDSKSVEGVILEDRGIDPLQGLRLSHGEVFGSVFQIKTLSPAEGAAIGDLVVEWSRPQGPICICRLPIHSVRIAEPPIEVALHFPSQSNINSIIRVVLSIKNNQDSLLKFSIRLSNTEKSFLHGGYDYFISGVEPHKTIQFNYNFIPVKLGSQNLPTFEVTTEGSSQLLKRAVLILP